MTTRTRRVKLVLWGFHPAHGNVALKLSTNTSHAAQERYLRQGWTVGVYEQGAEPKGLRVQAARAAGTRSNPREPIHYAPVQGGDRRRYRPLQAIECERARSRQSAGVRVSDVLASVTCRRCRAANRSAAGSRSNPGVQFRKAPFRFIFTKEGGRIVASAAPGDWRRVHDLRVVEMLSGVPMGQRRVRAMISRREYDALKRYLYAEGINHTDRTGEGWERDGWKA